MSRTKVLAASLIVCTLACTGACTGFASYHDSGLGRPGSSSPRTSGTGSNSGNTVISSWSMRQPVPVRLGEHEQKPSVSIEGAGSEALVLRRVAGGVASGAGHPQPSIEVVAADPLGGRLVLGERIYGGSLRVTPHPAGGLRVTNHVDLELYVRGVVAAELGVWSARPAAMEAQAIAARSYAVRSLRDRQAERAGPYLWNDTRDQVYRGLLEGDGASWAEVRRRLRQAVERTRGELLLQRGEVVDARFHASCGGETTRFANVFTNDQVRHPPDIAPVTCAICDELGRDEQRALAAGREPKTSAGVAWRFTATDAELRSLSRDLGIGDRLVRLRPTRADSAGRWLAVELGGPGGSREISLKELRQRIGPERLKSGRILRTWPHAGEPITGGIFFEGLGRGHGVGLCQIGARGLAEGSWSARDILGHYYPGTRIDQVRGNGAGDDV